MLEHVQHQHGTSVFAHEPVGKEQFCINVQIHNLVHFVHSLPTRQPLTLALG